jgi:DNA-binding CsgD family transcriptional regulator
MRIDANDLARILPPVDTVAGSDVYAAHVGRALADIFGASRTVFIDWSRTNASPENLAFGDVHFLNWAPARKRLYYEHFRMADPISRRCFALRKADGRGVFRITDIVPGRQFRRSDFFLTLLKPENLQHVITLALADGDRLLGDFSLVREATCRDFDAPEIELAHALVPALSLAWSAAARRCRMKALTARERDIAGAVGAGLSNKLIAGKLGISPWTVKNHLKTVFEKTGAASRTELCALLNRQTG